METIGLLLIGLAVVVMILVIQALLKRGLPVKLPPADLVVLTYNSAHQIEGIIRSSLRSARKEGQDLRVYVIDEGSNDDTLQIVNKFKQAGLYIKVLTNQEQTRAVLSAVDCCYRHLPHPAEQPKEATPTAEKHQRDKKDQPAQIFRGREIRVVDMRRRI